MRIERLLHLSEGRSQPPPHQPLDELRAHQPVAVLPGMGSPQVEHDLVHLGGDGAHAAHVGRLLEVEGRAHVQASHRRVRVPGAVRPVPAEHSVDPHAELRQAPQGHGAVLHEGDRLHVAWRRHDDAQPGLAHTPDPGLVGRGERAPHGAGVAQIAHHLLEPVQPLMRGPLFERGELHHQHRPRLPGEDSLHHGPEGGVRAGQPEHVVVHQLDRSRIEGDDVLHGVERALQVGEAADAQQAVRGQAGQIEFEGGEEGERSLRADQQRRQVQAGTREAMQVVAGDVSEHLRHPPRQFFRLADADLPHAARQRVVRASVLFTRPLRHLAEAERGPVREHRVDGAHPVGHDAVTDRPRPGAVVSGHAAKGGPAGGRHIHRIEQPVRRQPPVQVVEHHAGFDPHGLRLHIQAGDGAQVLAGVDHQSPPHRLPALRRPRPPRQHRHPFLHGDPDRGRHVLHGARHHHPHRFDLVDGGVGAVEPAADRIEEHLALQLAPQPGGEGEVADAGSVVRHGRASLACRVRCRGVAAF